jgi:hypothetical protein
MRIGIFLSAKRNKLFYYKKYSIIFVHSSSNFNNYVEPTVEVHINESNEVHDDSPVPVFEVSINNGTVLIKCV